MRLTAKVCAITLVLLMAGLAQAKVIRAGAETVSLYSAPATGAAIVTTVSKGTLLGVLEENGYWLKVKALKSGAVGYVHLAFVDAVAATPPVRDGSYPAAKATSPRQQPPPQQPIAPPRHQPPPQTPAERLTGSGSDKSHGLTIWGGLLSGGGSYPAIGGTFGVFVNEARTAEIEVGGDYAFVGGGVDTTVSSSASNAYGSYGYNSTGNISSSGRIILISGAFNYNFSLESSRVRPYAAGGLVYGRASGSWGITDNYDSGLQTGISIGLTESEIAFQLGGGVKFPIGNGSKLLRGDFKIIKFPSTFYSLRFGVIF